MYINQAAALALFIMTIGIELSGFSSRATGAKPRLPATTGSRPEAEQHSKAPKPLIAPKPPAKQSKASVQHSKASSTFPLQAIEMYEGQQLHTRLDPSSEERIQQRLEAPLTRLEPELGDSWRAAKIVLVPQAAHQAVHFTIHTQVEWSVVCHNEGKTRFMDGTPKKSAWRKLNHQQNNFTVPRDLEQIFKAPSLRSSKVITEMRAEDWSCGYAETLTRFRIYQGKKRIKTIELVPTIGC